MQWSCIAKRGVNLYSKVGKMFWSPISSVIIISQDIMLDKKRSKVVFLALNKHYKTYLVLQREVYTFCINCSLLTILHSISWWNTANRRQTQTQATSDPSTTWARDQPVQTNQNNRIVSLRKSWQFNNPLTTFALMQLCNFCNFANFFLN